MKNLYSTLTAILFLQTLILSAQYSITVVDDPVFNEININNIVQGRNDETLILAETEIYTFTNHLVDTFTCSLCSEITDLVFVGDTMYIANKWSGIVKYFGDSSIEVTPFNVLNLVAGKGGNLYGIEFSEGIVTWDGTEWKHLTEANSSIPTDDIYDLAVDSNGLLWMASYVGLISYDGVTFSLKTVPNDLSSTFYNIGIDYYNSVWVGSAYGGMGRYKNGQWKTFPGTFDPFDLVQNVAVTNGNKIWTSEISKGLFRFNGITFEEITFEDLGMTDWNNNNILFGDAMNRLWIKNDFMPLMYLTTGTTAIHDNSHTVKKLIMYPNPATDVVHLSGMDFLNKDITVKILQADGQLFRTEHISCHDGYSLDVSKWMPGIYELLIDGNDKAVYTGRVCVIPED